MIDPQGTGEGATQTTAGARYLMRGSPDSTRYVPNRTDSACSANYHLFSHMRVGMRRAARTNYGSATTYFNLAERQFK